MDNIKRRTFLKGIFGTALTPLTKLRDFGQLPRAGIVKFPLVTSWITSEGAIICQIGTFDEFFKEVEQKCHEESKFGIPYWCDKALNHG